MIDDVQTTESPQRRFPPSPWKRSDIAVALLVDAALFGMALVLGILLAVVPELPGIFSRIPRPAAIVSLLSEVSFLLVAWLLVRARYRLPWSALGFRKFNATRSLGFGCLFTLSSFAFNFLWNLLLAAFTKQRAQPDILPFFGGGFVGLALALLVGGIAAPLCEEAFFRGYLFAGLRSRMSFRKAAFWSAVVFAFGHLPMTSWPPVFVMGFLFAALYEQSDSLWPGVLMHASINTFSLVLSFVLQSLAP